MKSALRGDVSGEAESPSQPELDPESLTGSGASAAGALIVFAFLVRLGALLVFGLNAALVSWGDDHVYDEIAHGMLAGQYDNYWFPPGYPLILALVYATLGPEPWGVRLFQALLGALTCGLVLLVGRRLYNARVGLLAGLLMAVYPGHIYMTWRVMSETIFTLLVASSLWLVLRFLDRPTWQRGAGLGLSLGALAMLKSNLLLFPPFLFAWLAYRLHRNRRLAALAPVLATFFLASLVTPVANWIALDGRISLLAGNGGITFWAANNPEAAGYFVMLEPEAEAPIIQQYGLTKAFEEADPVERGGLYRQLAIRWILDHPGETAVLLWRKLFNAFAPTAHAATLDHFEHAFLTHVLSYGLLLPFIVVGLVLSFGRNPSNAPLHLLLLSFTLMVLIFYGTPRFTLSMMPAFMVLAGQAMVVLYSRLLPSRAAPRGSLGTT